MQPELLALIERALKEAESERDRCRALRGADSTKVYQASMAILSLKGAQLHVRSLYKMNSR